jgi:hypothetical protein
LKEIFMNRKIGSTALAGIVFAILATTAQAGIFIYPSKGQSAEQQQKDEGACHQWAQKQTGVNPTQIAEESTSLQAYQQPQNGMRRSIFGGAGRGAALGAIGGAIGGDAGKGAEMGAAMGAAAGLFRDRQRTEEQNEYNQAVASKQKAALDEFQQAYETCLRGRGYTVSQ